MPKFAVDTNLVKEISDLMNECELTELEYSQGSRKIRLSKANKNQAVTYLPSNSFHQNIDSKQHELQTQEIEDISGHILKSPMVGTAYLAPSPDTAPFVKVGDAVEQGTTVLIIEAMKVMNQIKAPISGKITKICVENEEPVEYDQHLMIIEE